MRSVGEILTTDSKETENLQRTTHGDHNHREGYLSGVQRAGEPESGVESPFILDIPELQSRPSLPQVTNVNDQQLGDLNKMPPPKFLDRGLLKTKATSKAGRRASKIMKKSYCGLPHPSFPASISKRIASTFARSLSSKPSVLDKETLKAITDATDQYFGQLINDLGIFANHAGRKNIDESDVVAVMRR